MRTREMLPWMQQEISRKLDDIGCEIPQQLSQRKTLEMYEGIEAFLQHMYDHRVPHNVIKFVYRGIQNIPAAHWGECLA